MTGLSNGGEAIHRERIFIQTLRLSQQHLLEILTKVHSFIRPANLASEDWQVRETLSVSRSGKTITHEGEPTYFNFSTYPDFIDSVEYQYYGYRQDFSLIRISLNHYRREIIVEGKYQEQVEALVALIKQSFDRHTIWFGGGRGIAILGLISLFGITITALLIYTTCTFLYFYWIIFY